MELRHLRYFVAVAETGSFTTAAEQRLHTAQPSLSRQIRDLEEEVGVDLLIRGARGVELTAAGRAFLEHARGTLAQAESAIEAARRAAHRLKPVFALGFLTGQEIEWLPEAMRVLRDELPQIEVTVSSQYSPSLRDALVKGDLDLAFMRPEPNVPDLEYRLVVKEPLVVVLPGDHPLAACEKIGLQQFIGETFITVSHTAPTVRIVIDEFILQSGLDIRASYEVDNLAMAVSLVASTRGLALLPCYATNILPSSVTSRPLAVDPPTIDLVIGYSRTNTSPILSLFLSRIDHLLARCRSIAAETRASVG
ncbi:LysR family transcriptional regulator [Paraburkholderia fungorum]|uniref:LysR family transcriptional regulator n=1 Tax=Paraburkholderia fungorum TaxID=134537 RepID=UPI0038BA7610